MGKAALPVRRPAGVSIVGRPRSSGTHRLDGAAHPPPIPAISGSIVSGRVAFRPTPARLGVPAPARLRVPDRVGSGRARRCQRGPWLQPVTDDRHRDQQPRRVVRWSGMTKSTPSRTSQPTARRTWPERSGPSPGRPGRTPRYCRVREQRQIYRTPGHSYLIQTAADTALAHIGRRNTRTRSRRPKAEASSNQRSILPPASFARLGLAASAQIRASHCRHPAATLRLCARAQNHPRIL